MKSSTVWHGHSTRPSLSAGTARKASGHLSGRRPLHLANARPFGRLKAPLGLSLLRCAAQTRACLWQAEQAHHANNEKQEVPTSRVPIKQYLQKFPQWGKIWRDFGHAFSFASSSSRGIYPSPSYLIWMCCTRFPLDLSGAST